MPGEADPATLRTTSPDQEAKRALIRLECMLAPKGFLDRIALEEAQGNVVLAQVMRDSDTGRDLRAQTRVQPFRGHRISPDARLYRGAPASAGRRLLVAFTGQKQRLMMPVAPFLQRIDANVWDVLVLDDAQQDHFRSGVDGFADSFPALVGRVRRMAGFYRSATALGTSMGGFPAIRLAVLAGGMRGISVGGRPPFDLFRLFDRGHLPAAYDPVCACLAPQARDLILAHSQNHEIDRSAADHAAALTGGRRFGVDGTDSHGLLFNLWRDGRLGAFLATVLRDDISPDRMAEVFATAVADDLPPSDRKPVLGRMVRRVWPGRQG